VKQNLTALRETGDYNTSFKYGSLPRRLNYSFFVESIPASLFLLKIDLISKNMAYLTQIGLFETGSSLLNIAIS